MYQMYFSILSTDISQKIKQLYTACVLNKLDFIQSYLNKRTFIIVHNHRSTHAQILTTVSFLIYTTYVGLGLGLGLGA